MTMEEAFAEADRIRETPIREFHIVGGLHPKLRLSYYEDLLRGLKERYPGVEIKALTAVEIAHLARIEKSSIEDVLGRLRQAGLDSMPGGGAEVFSRRSVPQLQTASWLPRVAGCPSPRAPHEHSHELHDVVRPRGNDGGSRRAPHHAARSQDETSGFLTYIPLAYHPDNNELGEVGGRARRRADSTTSRTSQWAGCTSTTCRTSRRTGS
jgi:aminodeoxyfutalosine synthase